MMVSTSYLYDRKRATRAILWCCVLLLAIPILPMRAIAQDEEDLEIDPFGPPTTPKIARESKAVRTHLKHVECQLVYSKKDNSVIGIYFGSPSRDKRVIELKDLEGLPNLAKLKELVVPEEAGANDKWLPIIARCRNLERLSLPRSDITPEGLEILAKLSLTCADFGYCKWLNDEAMETIADWEDLRYLYLSDVPISDNGLHAIRGLTKLEELHISCGSDEGNPLITNKSVDVVMTFTKLRELSIWGTDIDNHGYAALREVLPKCKIY